MKKPIIVAIDGYSSCGKSTMAKQLAKAINYVYVDTGAMYRAVAYHALKNGWMTSDSMDEQALIQGVPTLKIHFETSDEGTQQTFLNGENVEKAIRNLEVSNGASRVSTLGFVREALVAAQQDMGKKKGIVMDGRDIGTVVFPNAELKVFVTASPEVRAQRRYNELIAKGKEADYKAVLANVKERDYRDTHRKESPLKQAEDALLLDNSNLTHEAQFEQLLSWFKLRNS